jgi:hypothetical protein
MKIFRFPSVSSVEKMLKEKMLLIFIKRVAVKNVFLNLVN